MSLLIPAGTELPYQSEEIREYQLEDTTDTIGIELYLGRGKTKNIPNRRIATRTVKFGHPYPGGTPISFQVFISSMRMMTMEAWITDRPETKTVMEMDMASLKKSDKSRKGIAASGRIPLNAKSELNDLKELAERNKEKSADLNEAINKKLELIKQASNPEDFFTPCMDLVNNSLQSDPMFGYVYTLAFAFRNEWTESQNRRIAAMAKRHFLPEYSAVKQYHYVQYRAMEFIAVSDPDFTAFFTDYLHRETAATDQMRQNMICNVVKFEKDDSRAAKFLKEFCRYPDVTEAIARNLQERYGTGTDKKNQGLLNKFVKMLADSIAEQEHDLVPRYIPILTAELCAANVPNPLSSDKYLWKTVKRFLDDEQEDVYRSLIISLWNGTPLPLEEYLIRQAYYPKAGLRKESDL